MLEQKYWNGLTLSSQQQKMSVNCWLPQCNDSRSRRLSASFHYNVLRKDYDEMTAKD